MIFPQDSDRDGDGPVADSRAETTGRQVVVFTDDGRRAGPTALLRSLTGVSAVTRSSEFESSAMDLELAEVSDAVLFDELGIAVVTADPDQLVALRTAAASPDVAVLSVEPELVHHALDSEDTVVEIARPENGAAAAEDTERFLDTPEFTWGLQATRTTTSACSGRGVRIAVLDTGFDFTHPDFHGRTITAQSFVPGAVPQDGHGHGTYCIGTACRPAAATGTRRYGVAHEADIFVGKVLSDQGRGVDGGILAGIEWAIANGCHIFSMSLGADVASVSVAYETVGQRALAAGALIVAAAGNNANRVAGRPGLVGVPANSLSIMAVSAVDPISGWPISLPRATRSPVVRSTWPDLACGCSRRCRCPCGTARRTERVWPPRTSRVSLPCGARRQGAPAAICGPCSRSIPGGSGCRHSMWVPG